MRQIARIFWHCTATAEGRDVDVATVRAWHRAQGWSDIGYHFLIRLDGTVEPGRPVEQPGAHVAKHNHDSIGIAYVGGVTADGKPKDTRTPAQRAALYALTARLLREHPGATVHGHNEHAAKACPSFDAQADWAAWLASQPPAPDDWRAGIEARLAALEALFPTDTKG